MLPPLLTNHSHVEAYFYWNSFFTLYFHFSWRILVILPTSPTARACPTGTVSTSWWSPCPLWVRICILCKSLIFGFHSFPLNSDHLSYLSIKFKCHILVFSLTLLPTGFCKIFLDLKFYCILVPSWVRV